MKHDRLVFVLYDGIDNSVFAGQVLKPLQEQLIQNPHLKITLISFERNIKSAQQKISHLNSPNLSILIAHKIPFIGKPTIWYAAWQLKKILKNCTHFTLIARGPIAGVISIQAIQNKREQLTIQARGLLEQEYLFEHADEKNQFKKLWHTCRAAQFRAIEQRAFGLQKTNCAVTIQAVSPALKEYLINTYKTEKNRITVAEIDIPPKIAPTQLTQWKHSIRNQLAIGADTHVYCYNGSIKPWQCPEKVIEFFKNELIKNPDSFLLILTQDRDKFEQLLNQSNIAPSAYQVLHVPHADIYRYLAACNVGLLFRQDHIVNWVSRPTKALEYKSAGLKIMHNNTVHYLTQL